MPHWPSTVRTSSITGAPPAPPVARATRQSEKAKHSSSFHGSEDTLTTPTSTPAVHGGCDVLDPEATKWSANFWLWNKPYHFVSPARKKQTSQHQAKWL